jgi:quinol monooxygenase YgiN
MSLIAIIGQFDIHPEDAGTAEKLMRTMMIETQREAGCLHYAFSTDLATPNRFQLSELWESEAALEAHFQSPHMAKFRSGLAQIRVKQRTVKRYRATEAADL